MNGRQRAPRAAGLLVVAFRNDRHDLRAYARRRLGDDGLADEVVQETFLRAWRSIHRFDSAAGTPRMWLFGICRNAASDVVRRRASERCTFELVDADEVVDPAPDDVLGRAVSQDRVVDALTAMTPAQRDAVIEVLLFDRSYAVAAATLGVPVGTVKSRVHNGLSNARRAAA